MNIKVYPCWKQIEKYRNKHVTFGFKKSWVFSRASKTNTENTHFTHIYLHHFTTTLRKAPYLSNVHMYSYHYSVSKIPARSDCCIGLQEKAKRRREVEGLPESTMRLISRLQAHALNRLAFIWAAMVVNPSSIQPMKRYPYSNRFYCPQEETNDRQM